MNDSGVFFNPCAVCKKREASKLCDYIIRYDNGVIFFRDRELFNKVNAPGYKHETCDLPMCDECATEIGRNVDVCPHHYQLHQQTELPKELRKYQQREKVKIHEDVINGGESE